MVEVIQARIALLAFELSEQVLVVGGVLGEQVGEDVPVVGGAGTTHLALVVLERSL